jgi:hypothetical protein
VTYNFIYIYNTLINYILHCGTLENAIDRLAIVDLNLTLPKFYPQKCLKKYIFEMDLLYELKLFYQKILHRSVTS